MPPTILCGLSAKPEVIKKLAWREISTDLPEADVWPASDEAEEMQQREEASWVSTGAAGDRARPGIGRGTVGLGRARRSIQMNCERRPSLDRP